MSSGCLENKKSDECMEHGKHPKVMEMCIMFVKIILILIMESFFICILWCSLIYCIRKDKIGKEIIDEVILNKNKLS